MADNNSVANHYTHGNLLDAIRAGVERLGKSNTTVTVEDLGPVEEFHIGGRIASESFLDQLQIASTDYVLDVGCGLGGVSRFVAHRYGSRVRGIDLTAEYIETGQELSRWVKLDHLITLEQGSATAMPYADATFDKAYMMHVGMNIADKFLLMKELYRVLKPGASLGIYDIMRTGEGDLTFPVPWASAAETSLLASPEQYKQAISDVGFQLLAERNRREFALEFFARLQASVAAAGGPPALGLHVLIGESAPLKFKNMIEGINQSAIAPVELIVEKPLR